MPSFFLALIAAALATLGGREAVRVARLSAALGGGGTLLVAGIPFRADGDAGKLAPGTTATVSARPEDLHILAGSETGPNRLAGTVTFVRDVGASIETYVEAAGETLVHVAAPKDRPPVSAGDPCVVEIPPESCVVLRQ